MSDGLGAYIDKVEKVSTAIGTPGSPEITAGEVKVHKTA